MTSNAPATSVSGFSSTIERELAALPSLQVDGPLGSAARALVLAPGAKRARPWLVRTFGEAAGVYQTEGLVDAAIGVELIHTASLLHDDVLDEAELRRGVPTANSRFGNTLAVLSGDWVLTCALERLARRPAFLRPAIEAVAIMTRGIAAEIGARRDPYLPLEAWRAIAHGKTGALFALCGRLVGLLARDEDRADAFASCGDHLGIAFQLADDLADLYGTATAFGGKGRFNDLRTGSPSYATLWACQADPVLARDLAARWADEASTAGSTYVELDGLGSRVLATGAADATAAAALHEVAEARAALGKDAALGPLVHLLGWAEALVDSARKVGS